jgi:cytochrome oxidase Cu insertion factor (SCO1/SenC/PrrC family)
MADRKRCQGLNSKCFLFTYLVIVGFLLVLWFNRTGLMHEDSRVIPAALQSYITSPPRPIEADISYSKGKQALTNEVFDDRWTLVYFSHANCLPACLKSFEKLAAFQSAFANYDVGVATIDLDSEENQRGKLASLVAQTGFKFPIIEAESAVIEALAKTFIALYLRTDFTNGHYQIEQEHHLFLVDPKSRVYAVFDEKVPSAEIKDSFTQLRQFYAITE